MKKPYIPSILCTTLLLLLSLQTVIGQEPHSPSSPLNSPLFTKPSTISTKNLQNRPYNINYLGSNKNTHLYHFNTPPSLLTQTLTILQKYVPHQDIAQYLTQRYQNQNPPTNQQLMHKILSETNQNIPLKTDTLTFTKEIKQLIDPYSTIFPTCVLLVIITIILLYTYILLYEVTDFILQVLENLL
jgi:hypothetical protein